MEIETRTDTEVFSSKDHRTKLLDKMLKLESFTCISISKTKCAVPLWTVVLVSLTDFFIGLAAGACHLFSSEAIKWTWKRDVGQGFGRRLDCHSVFDFGPSQRRVTH